ncbi:MAG: SCO family protein [Phycisphaerae bacterium]
MFDFFKATSPTTSVMGLMLAASLLAGPASAQPPSAGAVPDAAVESVQASDPDAASSDGSGDGFVGYRKDEKPAYPGAIDAGLRGIGVYEKLGNALPGEAVFRDESGRVVRLSDYFDGQRPVILQLGYYACPMLCGLVSEGLAQAIAELDRRPAEDYRVVSLSIDPRETDSLAYLKKQSFLREINKPGLARGWTFLTGDQAAIDAVAEATGFTYRWIPAEREFSHPSVIMVLTPDGKVSRYLYGVSYPTEDLIAALDAATAGTTMASANPNWLILCLQAVGIMGKYSGPATMLMRFGAVVTVLGLGGAVFMLFRRFENKPRATVRATHSNT